MSRLFEHNVQYSETANEGKPAKSIITLMTLSPPMELTFDGNSEVGAHVRSNLC